MEGEFAGSITTRLSERVKRGRERRFAQLHLRQSCVFLDMHPLNKPEVLIFQAQNKFDAAGKLTDDVAGGLIRDLMAALLRWTRQIAAP